MTFTAHATSGPKEWHRAANLSQEFRDHYPVLQSTDDDHLNYLAAQEVLEAEEAQNHLESSLLFNFFDRATEHAKEFADILIFLYSYTSYKGLQPQFEAAWQRANGQGTRSPIYDQLHEQVSNLSEGNVDANVTQLLTYLISLSNHLPYHLSVTEAMRETIKKNQANRPDQYYQKTDVLGQPLNHEQLQAKYRHTERALRLLRNHYGSPLQPWMHEYHRHEILDFSQSETNLTIIRENLLEQQRAMAIAIQASLYETTQPQTEVNPVFLRQLELAGAVPLANQTISAA